MMTDQTPSDHQIFNRSLIKAHRKRAEKHLAEHDFLLREVADRLYDKLLDVNRSFDHMVDLGSFGNNLSQLLNEKQPKSLIHQGLSQLSEAGMPEQSVAADSEFLPFQDESLDLVISNLDLHWANDLPGVLIQINRALKPDGLFLAALFGGETLFELRQSMMRAEINIDAGSSPHVSPMLDIRDAGGLLQRAGFALPVADTDRITVNYNDVFSLMKDLRGMGEANKLTRRFKGMSSRRLFMETNRVYHELFGADNDRIPATFDIIYLMGWAPDASQPKPLRPGSAKARLSDALGVKEWSAGEKAGQ